MQRQSKLVSVCAVIVAALSMAGGVFAQGGILCEFQGTTIHGVWWSGGLLCTDKTEHWWCGSATNGVGYYADDRFTTCNAIPV